MHEQLHENIKRIRRLRGLTQESIAEKLHISAKAYSKLENGETQLNFNRLGEIAGALDLDPLELLRFDEKQVFNHCQGAWFNSVATYGFENERKQYEERIAELKEQIADQKEQIEYFKKKLG